jgi:hypothetical protein
LLASKSLPKVVNLQLDRKIGRQFRCRAEPELNWTFMEMSREYESERAARQENKNA